MQYSLGKLNHLTAVKLKICYFRLAYLSQNEIKNKNWNPKSIKQNSRIEEHIFSH